MDRARKSSQGIVEARDEATAKRFKPGIETALRGCMSARDRSITLRAFDLRGDLADELLTEADGAALRVARTRRAIAPTRLQRADGDQNEAVVGCAVAADPVDASALIESGAATPAEIAAFRQLVPAIQACVPTDYSLHLKPFEVRRLVAIALYRYVADQSGGQS
ncbi:hypothetical protein EAH84_07765 [Sphingomonas oligophenolica]|uniref:Uncharacterized protein n=1 Tax=Sphingomonas oligophenolica TaxID=301154 RepID=A0A502CJ64_9SPHN|nr:hypothetical protein EAH84_07765 [Sphingomonas oligophenolica]